MEVNSIQTREVINFIIYKRTRTRIRWKPIIMRLLL